MTLLVASLFLTLAITVGLLICLVLVRAAWVRRDRLPRYRRAAL